MVAEERKVDLENGSPIPPDAKEILHKLASSWSNVEDIGRIQIIPMTGAMTNLVYQINWLSGRHDTPLKTVLLRIYGEGVDIFFDRNQEIRTFEFMSEHGQGPKLLGCFQNGRLEEFLSARTMSAYDLRNPEISSLIAKKMREFNDLAVPGSKSLVLWTRLRNWLQIAKSLSSPEEAAEFFLDQIGDEITSLEMTLAYEGQREGFCHNDLQYGNLMIDDDTKSLTVIDYEYAGYNPVAYDLANHFCEMAANYHTETPHVLDFVKYPDLNERRKFVQAYLSAGEKVNEVDLERLLDDVEKYTLASHLLWGLWGIISKHVNDIDFDYEEYARQRFQQYWARKPVLLGSETHQSV